MIKNIDDCHDITLLKKLYTMKKIVKNRQEALQILKKMQIYSIDVEILKKVKLPNYEEPINKTNKFDKIFTKNNGKYGIHREHKTSSTDNIFCKKNIDYDEYKTPYVTTSEKKVFAKTNCNEKMYIDIKNKELEIAKKELELRNVELSLYKQQINNTHKNRSVKSYQTRQCSTNSPYPVERRRFVPLTNANDAIYTNQVILGHLDVYHNIYYGKNRINLEDRLEYMSEQIATIGNLETNEIIPENYTPEISYLNNNDFADVVTNDIFYTYFLNSDKVDFRIIIPFNYINIIGHEVKLNLPFQINMEYYRVNDINLTPIININFAYNEQTQQYDKTSNISKVFVDNIESNCLIINSGLFQCFRQNEFEEFYLANSKFQIEIILKNIEIIQFEDECVH